MNPLALFLVFSIRTGHPPMCLIPVEAANALCIHNVCGSSGQQFTTYSVKKYFCPFAYFKPVSYWFLWESSGLYIAVTNSVISSLLSDFCETFSDDRLSYLLSKLKSPRPFSLSSLDLLLNAGQWENLMSDSGGKDISVPERSWERRGFWKIPRYFPELCFFCKHDEQGVLGHYQSKPRFSFLPLYDTLKAFWFFPLPVLAYSTKACDVRVQRTSISLACPVWTPGAARRCPQPTIPCHPPGSASPCSSDSPAVLGSSSSQPCPALPSYHGPHWSGLWPTDWHTAWPQTYLTIMDPPGGDRPWSWPSPVARLPGFQTLGLACHCTLPCWLGLWAEAGCQLWVCPAAWLVVAGKALPCGLPALWSPGPAGIQPSWLCYCAWLPSLQPSGSSQPLLHPDLKGREVHG